MHAERRAETQIVEWGGEPFVSFLPERRTLSPTMYSNAPHNNAYSTVDMWIRNRDIYIISDHY